MSLRVSSKLSVGDVPDRRGEDGSGFRGGKEAFLDIHSLWTTTKLLEERKQRPRITMSPGTSSVVLIVGSGLLFFLVCSVPSLPSSPVR
jgi:hypothetical protein